MPETASDGANPKIRGVADSDVECQKAHQGREGARPPRRQSHQYDGGRGDYGKNDVPRVSLHGVRTGEPPEIVPLRVLQSCEGELRALPRASVVAESLDERLERSEIGSDRRRPEAVIQGVLTERALGAVDGGEDEVQIEVDPGPLIERTTAQDRCSLNVRRGDGVHPPCAFDRCAPRCAYLSETLPLAITDQRREQQ